MAAVRVNQSNSVVNDKSKDWFDIGEVFWNKLVISCHFFFSNAFLANKIVNERISKMALGVNLQYKVAFERWVRDSAGELFQQYTSIIFSNQLSRGGKRNHNNKHNKCCLNSSLFIPLNFWNSSTPSMISYGRFVPLLLEVRILWFLIVSFFARPLNKATSLKFYCMFAATCRL